MVNDGLGGDAEQLAGRRRDLADRRLAARADVERLAVVGLGQVQRGVDERLGHVVDIDEVARDGRVDERRIVPSRPCRITLGISRAESSKGP